MAFELLKGAVVQFEGGYAGDVTAQEAFGELSNREDAVLVDVRTQAEWAFVGLPDLRPIGKEAVLTEWQGFPSSGPNPDFTVTVSDLLVKKGLDQDAPIYFLCRSGARSRAAAIAMTQAGYSRCFNISDGFEGPLDAEAHRGTQSGWKAAGLPWIQN
ncbi:rhodanese-like domain-containing protein [Roseibium salinum]|uniref:Rhodanese-like domain-containing protein n=1 Tax=Roseibium salinum TaxID=1604349 RepID=A0ABT3R628_9HYPH|nr:rhodanese-like domain-containing protein [Roseibium sp. DSM 29163]MCX2724493.1 rhodanese-like domain-containing protein [Roseibium sp. DSM 29163]